MFLSSSHYPFPLLSNPWFLFPPRLFCGFFPLSSSSPPFPLTLFSLSPPTCFIFRPPVPFLSSFALDRLFFFYLRLVFFSFPCHRPLLISPQSLVLPFPYDFCFFRPPVPFLSSFPPDLLFPSFLRLIYYFPSPLFPSSLIFSQSLLFSFPLRLACFPPPLPPSTVPFLSSSFSPDLFFLFFPLRLTLFFSVPLSPSSPHFPSISFFFVSHYDLLVIFFFSFPCPLPLLTSS